MGELARMNCENVVNGQLRAAPDRQRRVIRASRPGSEAARAFGQRAPRRSRQDIIASMKDYSRDILRAMGR